MPESNLDQISPETGEQIHRVAMTQVAAPTKPPTGSTLQRKNCVMPPRMRPLALVRQMEKFPVFDRANLPPKI